MKTLEQWRGDFRKPHKINITEKKVKAEVELSEDEFNLLRAYGNDIYIYKISAAFQCSQNTIMRTIKSICKRITSNRYKTIEIQKENL